MFCRSGKKIIIQAKFEEIQILQNGKEAARLKCVRSGLCGYSKNGKLLYFDSENFNPADCAKEKIQAAVIPANEVVNWIYSVTLHPDGERVIGYLFSDSIHYPAGGTQRSEKVILHTDTQV